jgi:polar amino acid transport system substrate-binding protein
MTVTAQRAQLVAFTRPYYLEGVALLISVKGKHKNYKALQAAGKSVKVSVLQNVYADNIVHAALPQAQVMQLDTEANAIQAVDSGRADAAAIDLSTVRWLVKRNPNAYIDSGYSYYPQIYSAAVRQGDQDWLNWVNTAFTVAMFATEGELYDKGLEDYFGLKPPVRKPGFPPI